MNIKTLVTAAAIALALGAGGVRAQTISGPPGGVNAGEADGDLILGFTNPTTPTANDLVYDIGSASSYSGLAPGTYTVSAYQGSADVTSVLGSSAFTSGNVVWGIIGGNSGTGAAGAPNETVWAATPGAALTAGSAQTTLSDNIDGFTNSGVGNGAQLSDNPNAVTVPYGVGFNQQATAQGSAAEGTFGYFSSSILGTLGTTTTMQLYELIAPVGSTPGQRIDLGTFALSGSTLTFTPFEAIPEPSTYAAVLGALTIGFVLIRRRNRSAGISALA
jgi:hypothetical protein